MANLTLAMDDTLLHDARRVAFERDISLTEMIREHLNDVVNGWRLGKKAKAKQLMEIIEKNSRHFGGITWSREDLYERR
jgi:hypothetical protein